jgi:integrase
MSCPECGSSKVWKDGIRRTEYGDVQRYLCRSCGLRFSDPSVQLNIFRELGEAFESAAQLPQDRVRKRDFSLNKVFEDPSFSLGENVGSHRLTVIGKGLNSFPSYNSNYRVCANKKAKNLAINTEITQAPREGTEDFADVKGMLVTYEAKLTLKGLDIRTIQRRITMLKLLCRRGADLFDAETVFQTIDQAKKWNWNTGQLSEEPWSEGTKNNAAQAYASFCTVNKLAIPETVNFHKWSRQPQKLPWVPLETEIDQLIAGCKLLPATFLQLLKETGMRCGEATRLLWINIDLEHGILTVDRPEKHSNPRQFKVSGKLVAMLNRLPKQKDQVFLIDLRTMRKRFMWQRNRIAFKVENPRLKQITFHTLRHYYGSMEYFRTKDILHVQERLGHRSITSTLIYTHLINFEGDEFHTATAKTLKEDEELLKAGFEYVTERDDVKIYRKRK